MIMREKSNHFQSRFKLLPPLYNIMLQQVNLLCLLLGTSVLGESTNPPVIDEIEKVEGKRDEDSFVESDPRGTRGQRDLYPFNYYWTYQQPVGSAAMVQPNGEMVNWVYLRPATDGLVYVNPRLHPPLHGPPRTTTSIPQVTHHHGTNLHRHHSPTAFVPSKPMFIPANIGKGDSFDNSSRGRHGYPSTGSGPIEHQGVSYDNRQIDEVLVDDLYSKKGNVIQTGYRSSTSSRPVYYEGPPSSTHYVDPRPTPETVFLSSGGFQRPSSLPYSYSTASPVHIQRIAPRNRKLKEHQLSASSTLSGVVSSRTPSFIESSRTNYHAPDQRISTFGHPIIHDKNE